MKLFPYENYYIISPFKPEEAENKLQASIYIPGVENGMNVGFKYDVYSNKYFKGFAMYNSFKIAPDINYRNSFAPDIMGNIAPYISESRINIKMKLTGLAIGFMSVWFGFLIVAAISVIIKDISAEKSEITIIPIGILFILGYCLVLGSFKYESIRCKRILLEIFEGEVQN
jgi:hypothetical protein